MEPTQFVWSPPFTRASNVCSAFKCWYYRDRPRGEQLFWEVRFCLEAFGLGSDSGDWLRQNVRSGRLQTLVTAASLGGDSISRSRKSQRAATRHQDHAVFPADLVRKEARTAPCCRVFRMASSLLVFIVDCEHQVQHLSLFML